MFLTLRFYIAMGIIIVMFSLSYSLPWLFKISWFTLLALIGFMLIDFVSLYYKKAIKAQRKCNNRFSNGDENKVVIEIENKYIFPVSIEVIDEIPIVFQRRDVLFKIKIKKAETKDLVYHLKPFKRGAYQFDVIHAYTSSPIGLIQRGYHFKQIETVKVYPSYKQLHQYELMAINNKITDQGIKRIRKIGNNTDFEHIKEYVKGDEYRSMNWKASARRGQLMVNVYQDERSQSIFNVIDKGRVMQQAFEKMTLLDYAINASLVLSYIAMNKDDKVGLITFDKEVNTFLPATKKKTQMQEIQERLYNEKNTFGESDFSNLCIGVNRLVNKRSLFILYTNFINLSSLQRQLPYIIQLAQHHRVLVVFFEDNEMIEQSKETPTDVQGYYTQAMLYKGIQEKHSLVTHLKNHGVLTLLTSPDKLTADVINKYLDIKQRNMLT